MHVRKRLGQGEGDTEAERRGGGAHPAQVAVVECALPEGGNGDLLVIVTILFALHYMHPNASTKPLCISDTVAAKAHCIVTANFLTTLPTAGTTTLPAASRLLQSESHLIWLGCSTGLWRTHDALLQQKGSCIGAPNCLCRSRKGALRQKKAVGLRLPKIGQQCSCFSRIQPPFIFTAQQHCTATMRQNFATTMQRIYACGDGQCSCLCSGPFVAKGQLHHGSKRLLQAAARGSEKPLRHGSKRRLGRGGGRGRWGGGGGGGGRKSDTDGDSETEKRTSAIMSPMP